MKKELKEIFEKCESEQEKCPLNNEGCYKDKGIRPLIFDFDTEPKIMLISESPYNFPSKKEIKICHNRCTLDEAETKDNFIKNHLQEALSYIKDCVKYKASCSFPYFPCNIFDFIYITFYPIFKNCSENNWADKFLKKVYWTHAAKRSLKKNFGRRKKSCYF